MERMEKVSVCKDVKSFECSSLTELDRKFFGEQSLLSALSLEHLSSSKSSSETVADGSGGRGSVLAYLCLSDAVSPCQEFSFFGSNMQEAESCNLTVPTQGRFSTPNTMVQNPKITSCFNQSSGTLTASLISWDMSLIKAESHSPRLFIDSSAVEQTQSPKLQNSLAEVCSDLGR